MREREREYVYAYANEKEGRQSGGGGGGKSVECTVRCAGEERGNVSGMERGRGGCNGYAYV